MENGKVILHRKCKVNSDPNDSEEQAPIKDDEYYTQNKDSWSNTSSTIKPLSIKSCKKFKKALNRVSKSNRLANDHYTHDKSFGHRLEIVDFQHTQTFKHMYSQFVSEKISKRDMMASSNPQGMLRNPENALGAPKHVKIPQVKSIHPQKSTFDGPDEQKLLLEYHRELDAANDCHQEIFNSERAMWDDRYKPTSGKGNKCIYEQTSSQDLKLPQPMVLPNPYTSLVIHDGKSHACSDGSPLMTPHDFKHQSGQLVEPTLQVFTGYYTNDGQFMHHPACSKTHNTFLDCYGGLAPSHEMNINTCHKLYIWKTFISQMETLLNVPMCSNESMMAYMATPKMVIHMKKLLELYDDTLDNLNAVKSASEVILGILSKMR